MDRTKASGALNRGSIPLGGNKNSMRKQFLILIFGHFASGKTTLAKKIEKEFNFSRVNSDDIRDFLISKIKHYSGAHYSYYNDKINSANRVVSKFKDYLIKELLRQGQSLIIDGGRKTRDKRKKYVRLKKICSKKLISIIIETKLDEKKIIKRLKSRDAKNKPIN